MALFEKKTIINTEIDYEKLADIIAKTKSIEIDYDKLAKSIVNASKDFEKGKETEEEGKRQDALKELREKYNIQDEIKGTGIKVFFKKICNNINYIRAFLGYNEKQAAYPVMTFELIRTISALFFGTIEVVLIILGGIVIFGASFYNNILFRIGYAIMGFLMVFYASFFRISRLEIRNMKNKEMLNALFSAIMAFLGVFFAFITLLKELH